MIIDDLLLEAKMSRYKLSKESGVAQATISDICNGKASMEKCSAGTLYKIAKVLNVTVDSLLEAEGQSNAENKEYRSSFETFKSNICHHVKDMGDIDFIIEILESDKIRNLYKKKWYPESLYLLGMVDYLSKVNDLPICTNYNDIRKHKLAQTVYPSSVLIRAAVMHSEEVKAEARRKAIPEFMRFNIVESEVRNLV
ncbi:DNA-binding helix-turn-helix protein [Marvinbryantia formatexigens DSM 14469]|uniref:DNA-binding helix-turn-helix protein n=1 Tax=Marvinbryantia formatexigens DSM 14469 TaxID=478749 RepID=C6L8V4_9FIRM|nr:helix-turn-helix transcriptional regulator [Marvinbryantia formatexigens]EET62693.1 DNA-binding helix-turn-helix protein [Marvinbryantia formatexigens DSM 14469]UWO23065.1 helix-turn-helix transcriptional regulator [Marvinbryantia formatexigens DSM 14469]SDF97809.1 Cro/C1-type HTH DNA-binding domain-containing protein [Marvinbryantia formatexigens]